MFIGDRFLSQSIQFITNCQLDRIGNANHNVKHLFKKCIEFQQKQAHTKNTGLTRQ
ncbi:hypothetical protein JCM19233_3715 [Vibrio astriarenae]|nr:hypothetical protein JCM19233_3715 [Vibrio sp. C7]